MDTPVTMVGTTLRNASEHRRLLIDSMVRVTDGRMTVPQANAIAALSAEVHKSLRAEWEVVQFAAETFGLGPGGKMVLLQHGADGGE